MATPSHKQDRALIKSIIQPWGCQFQEQKLICTWLQYVDLNTQLHLHFFQRQTPTHGKGDDTEELVNLLYQGKLAQFTS